MGRFYKTVAKNTNWDSVWRAIMDLKSLVNVERKFNDVQVTPAQQSKTATITSLSAVSEGSDYNQRTGLSIKADSLYVRGSSYAYNTSATSDSNLRMLIIRDNEGLGSAPTEADIFEYTGDINSPINHLNGKRFTVLYDKVFNYSINGPTSHTFKKYIKLGHHIKYANSTTGTREGHIYFVTQSDTNTAVNEPYIGFDSRLRFIDN